MFKTAQLPGFVQMLREELEGRGLEPPVHRHPRGATIFRQGDPPDGIYLVLEGRVAISAGLGQTGSRVLSTFGPGDFFGEMALIENDCRSASATAETDTTLLFVSQELLGGLVEDAPQLVPALLREFSRRLRGFDRKHVHELHDAERIAMLGNFTRSIIHDLKNPLGAIGLAGEMCASASATPEVRRNAGQIISQQVERVVRMLNEILRVTEGGRPERLEPNDFAAYIAQTTEEIRPEFARQGILLEVGNPPPLTLLLHPERLTHVFYNLCHNAGDFMPRGGSIFIRFAQKPGEVITEVEDTGPGLTPEIVDKLFTPFFTHGKKNGTGLGLSICKNIIEDHGGRIWARAEPGRGAIFAFSIPLPPPAG